MCRIRYLKLKGFVRQLDNSTFFFYKIDFFIIDYKAVTALCIGATNFSHVFSYKLLSSNDNGLILF